MSSNALMQALDSLTMVITAQERKAVAAFAFAPFESGDYGP